MRPRPHRSPRRRAVTRACALAAALITLAAATSCSWTDIGVASCTDEVHNQVVVPEDHAVPYPGFGTFPDQTTFVATGRTFDTGTTSDYAFKIHAGRTGDGTCVVGGTFTTQFDPEDTPWDTWHASTSMIVSEPDVHLVNQRFYNVGDAARFASGATDWRISGMRVEALEAGQPGGYVHDDCVENDHMYSGVIRDSKFDGCWVFISANSSNTTRRGGDNTIEVYDSFVRMQPYRNSYNVPVRGENTWGKIFKFSPRGNQTTGEAPNLLLDNVMVRADTRGHATIRGLSALPEGTVCRNVTLVAKGGWGDDPANPVSPAWMAVDVATWTSQCTGLTFADEHVWDEAIAQWDALHPLG